MDSSHRRWNLTLFAYHRPSLGVNPTHGRITHRYITRDKQKGDDTYTDDVIAQSSLTNARSLYNYEPRSADVLQRIATISSQDMSESESHDDRRPINLNTGVSVVSGTYPPRRRDNPPQSNQSSSPYIDRSRLANSRRNIDSNTSLTSIHRNENDNLFLPRRSNLPKTFLDRHDNELSHLDNNSESTLPDNNYEIAHHYDNNTTLTKHHNNGEYRRSNDSDLTHRHDNDHGYRRDNMSANREGGGRVNPRNSPVLTFSVILAVSMVSVVTVLSLSGGQLTSTLTLQVPSNVKIRHVRSVADGIDLNSINLPSSSKAKLFFYDSAECTDEISSCKAFATCDSISGSRTCRCRTGYYVQDNLCQECSRTCPAGQYMITPCTTSTDVVCKPLSCPFMNVFAYLTACRVCNGSLYEVAPCTTTQDRLCLDVAFPVRGKLTNNTSSNTDSVSFTASENVFMEKLRGIKSLGESLYMKNNRQRVDLGGMRRESGLELKVHINVYLLPQYRDLDQKGDNTFITNSFRTGESEKNGLNKIKQHYCRNTVPDDYHLGLRIIPDRTSAVNVVRCNSYNTSLPRCPEKYKNGDVYVQRLVHKSCDYTVATPPVPVFANSILCTDDCPLLENVFKIRGRQIRKRTFPSADCVNAKNNCVHCERKAERECNLHDSQCCKSNCHAKPHCQLYHSEKCPELPTQCATGDVYEFTLEPNSRSLSSRFQCYLRRHKPPNLYDVSYTVSIPSLNIQFPTQHRNVTFSDDKFNLHANYSIDFFQVSHNAGVTAPDDVIAIGVYGKTNNLNIALHPLKKNFTNKKLDFGLVNPTDNSFTVGIQFDQPFRYSTSSWGDQGCYKNISHIHPAQPVFEQKSINVTANIRKEGDAFHYEMYPRNGLAYIRIKIPAGASVLSWFKHLYPSSMIDRSKLFATLHRGSEKGYWTINISGVLLSCPGYLSLTLRDQCLGVIINNYDIFIKCPFNFSITLTISTSKVNSSTAVFTLTIIDHNQTYNIFLSSFNQPRYLSILHNESRLEDAGQSPWRPVIAMLVATVFLVLFILLVNTCMRKRIKDSGKRTVEIGDAANATYLSAREMEHLHSKPTIKPLRKTPISKCLLTVFVLLYLCYALLFTCTVTCGLIYLMIQTNTVPLSNISLAKTQIEGNFTAEMNQMSDYTDYEINRVFYQAKNRFTACSFHLERELRRVSDEIKNNSQSSSKTINTGSNNSLQDSLINLIHQNAEKYNETVHGFIDDFRMTVRRKLETITLDYHDYLAKIDKNGWMSFPRRMYTNEMKGEVLNEGVKVDEVKVDTETGFVEWLGVENVNEVIDARDRLLSRLKSRIPNLKSKDFFIPHEGSTVSEILSKQSKYYTDHLLKFVQIRGKKVDNIKLNTEKNSETITDTQKDAPQSNKNATSTDTSTSTVYIILVICCVTFDVVLFFNRITWLGVNVKSLLNGFEQKVPLDSIASRLLRYQPVDSWTASFHEPLDHNTSEIMNADKNNINSLSGTDMHFFPQNVPKAKENIIQEVFARRKLHRQISQNADQNMCFRYIEYITHKSTDLSSSRTVWKFLMLLLILWMLCMITHVINTYVTVESTLYVFGMGLLLPQLRDHTNTTNSVIRQYTSQLNHRISQFDRGVDDDVRRINAVINKIILQQTAAWSQLTTNACHALANTSHPCHYTTPIVPSLSTAVLSCNLVPVTALPYLSNGSYSEPFSERVTHQIMPIIDELRAQSFSLIYVLTGFICIGVLIHLLTYVILRIFLRHDLIPITMVYQATHGATDIQADLQGDSALSSAAASRNNVAAAASNYINEAAVVHRESNL